MSTFGPGLIGGRAPLFRSNVATNCGIPYTMTTSPNWVQNGVVQCLVTVAHANPRLAFANYVLSAQGELTTPGTTSGYYDFVLRAGILVQGTYYQLTQNGSIDITVPFGTVGYFDPVQGLVIPAGTPVWVFTRRVAVIQSWSSYNILASHGTSAGAGEGVLAGTNPALDYTMGAVPGGHTASLVFSVTGGAPTATIGTNKGAGYTSTPSITVMDPTVYGTTNTAAIVTNAVIATGQPVITCASTTNVAVGMLVGGHPSIPAGATVASFVAGTSVTLSVNLTGTIGNGLTVGLTIPSGGGAGWAQTATQSGGALTGAVSNTGKGFDYSSRTVAALTGGGGFGANSQGYGPCAFTGETAFRTISHQMLGNSITRGVGADDGIGDESRAFGIFNRAYASHRIAAGQLPYGYIETSYIGNELVSIAGNNYAITYGMVAQMCRPTSVHVCNGTNDFAATVTVGVTGGTAGQAVITCANTTSIVVGLSVNGNAAIPAGCTVVSKVTNTSFTISQNLTATISGSVTASQFGLANVQASILSIIARERALGKKVICETTPPRTTSTDAWTTVANQTPISAAFVAGGIVDQYDAWLLSIVGTPTGPDYALDIRATCRDATLTDRWDTSHGPASTDGIHPLQVDRIALALAALSTNGVPNLVAG